MSAPLNAPPPADEIPVPRVPTSEQWSALTPAARDQAVERILDALESQRIAMAEGTRHSRPKIGAATVLSEHFQRAGRRVFLATELAVLYPGEDPIVPDLLAVLDTDPAKDVDSWRVMDEGRGIDFILEFRNQGKKHKDREVNVREYARLGITEYFSMDCRRLNLRAWRLPKAGAKAYVPILGQGGRFESQVLGLEMALVEGRLRFFQSQAMIPDSAELVVRLESMIGERDRQLEDAERQRDAAEQGQRDGLRKVAERVLGRLSARGIQVSPAQREQILECADMDRLLDWLERAVEVPDMAALLA